MPALRISAESVIPVFHLPLSQPSILDSEFLIGTHETRENLLEQWKIGWRLVFDAIHPLSAIDLGRTVYIRNEPHSVLRAISRQLTHYAYHVGQIVFPGKHFAAGHWRSLSVPRGKSEEFNAEMRKKRQEFNVVQEGPGGTSEKSPAIYRWDGRSGCGWSPVGTTEIQAKFNPRHSAHHIRSCASLGRQRILL